jgi:hypothetical protein
MMAPLPADVPLGVSARIHTTAGFAAWMREAQSVVWARAGKKTLAKNATRTKPSL